MNVIFLSIVTLGIFIFFLFSQSISKFWPNKRLRYASMAGYTLQLSGLVGLIIYHTEFMSSSPLQIELNVNSPDLIRAFAELLWPVTAMLGIFWFLPQILDFLKDPRKTIPLLTAFSGKHIPKDNQDFVDSIDIAKLPHYANLSDAHKELIELLKSQLGQFPQEEEKSRLLIYASECQLLADFERIYNLIYGSQIQALQMLSKNMSADISSFYDIHKQKTEEVIDIRFGTFKEWVRLLTESSIISENENKYSLTNRGKAFLKFLEMRNYYLLKAF